MFKKQKNVIEYWTDVPGLTEIEDACPTPYKNIKPSWWKNVPTGDYGKNRTAKNCPSFHDLFSNAFVMRMWCDSRIFKGADGEFFWETSSNKFIWQGHSSSQLLDYLPTWLNEKVWATPKPVSPWFAKVPKGYSVYQMPVMYDANPHFIALEGVIHSDRYHSLNVPMMVFSEQDEFEIKLGTPLALHIPFKREKFSHEVREATEHDKYLQEKSGVVAVTKFKNSYRNNLKDIYKNL